jgi:hypothetical protein
VGIPESASGRYVLMYRRFRIIRSDGKALPDNLRLKEYASRDEATMAARKALFSCDSEAVYIVELLAQASREIQVTYL